MTDAGTSARVGRPRRFDEATERTLVLDAGLRVIQRNGYAEATLVDIVAEAGLSRRALYRHFDSKDAVLVGIVDREAALVTDGLRRAVDRAPSGVAALEAWTATFLGLFIDPPKRARADVLASEAVRRAAGFSTALQRMDQQHAAPLADAIRRGVTEGTITSDDPDRDAAVVHAVVMRLGSRLLEVARPDADGAIAQVRRFCWPALGLPGAV